MTTDPDANPEDPQGEPLDSDYDVSTVIDNLQGVANTGSGDQYNDLVVAGDWVAVSGDYYHQVYQQVEARRRAANPQAVPEDRIAWLQDRFVQPESFHQAEEMLAGSAATVLIAGPAGSGRQTAAQMLLCPPDSGYRSLRRLPPEPDTPADPVLDDSQVTSSDRLLLDLSEVDRELFDRHQQQLPSFRDAVQRSGARLAVVLPHDQKHRLTDELRPLRVTLGRPDPLRVLRTHLSADQLLVSDDALQSDELSRQLSTEPRMSRVSRLAELIGKAAARAPGEPRDFSRWLTEALDALNNHAIAVVDALRTPCKAPARALLLSTAILEGARVAAVDHAERELLRITGYPEAETPRLERPDLFDRIELLEADVDGEFRVRFRKLDYGRAVLTHFWDRYPGMHRQCAQWVQGLAGLPQFTNEDRYRLADRFVEQSLRADCIGDLLRTAEVWAQYRYQNVRSLAYMVLATAVIDARSGRFVRRRLYHWAQKRQLHIQLARVIIEICANVLGPSYPDRALVRLHLLARHSDRSVAAQARQALVALAADDRFFRRLLAKLTEAREFNAELFLELVDPKRLTDSSPLLIADQSIQEQLISGWRQALVDHQNPACIAVVHRWLQACTNDPQREVLLGILVDACQARPDLCARLFKLNLGWEKIRTGPADQQCRHQTASHLKRKIDQARGLDRVYSCRKTTVEEANR